MKCFKCKKAMEYTKNLEFNKYKIDGWKCSKCGEEYYNPEKAEKILLLNKLKKSKFHLKLSQVKSNLILRIPKEVGKALNLHKGEKVEFCLRDSDEIVIHALKAKE